MKRSLLAVTSVLCLASSLLAADPMTIARDGKSDWVIVASDIPAESLAAEEIAKYIHRMSGALLPVQHQRPGPSRGAIVVASRHDIDAVATPGITAEESSGVFVSNGRVLVTGGSPSATLHAAYLFLDSLGCRFLAPSFDHYHGSAEVVPRLATLSVPADFRLAATPALKFRKLYVEEGHSHTTENLKQLVEWMPKAGYNTLVVPTNYQGHDKVKWDNWRKDLTPELQKRGITIEVGGHGYQNFINASIGCGQLFEAHPDWFGQDANGVRRKEPSWVFCTSNPDAVDYLTREFIDYIKDRPEIQIYDFWPPDGSHWCECEKCRALGTPSDRQALLLKHVRAAVAKVRPDLRLEMIAYASYTTPPEHQPIDPSILVDFCPISQQFDHQIDDPASKRNADYASALKAWRTKFTGDLSIYSYYRKYAWDSLPLVIPHYIQHDLQWYHTLPTQGISTYCEPGDWFTYELNHYCLAALAWDPNTDLDALIRKFATARYGPASDAALTAYVALEDTVRTDCSVPNTSRKPLPDLQSGEHRLQSAKSAVQSALSAATTDAIKYNLTRLSLTLDYAIGDLQTLELVAQKNLPAARARAAALFTDTISPHLDDGVFLSRDGRLSQSRLLTRTGAQGRTPSAE